MRILIILLALAIPAAAQDTLDCDVAVERCTWAGGTATISTATVNLFELTPDLHRYDLQIWEHGELVLEGPAHDTLYWVKSFYRPEYRLVDRETGESVRLIRTQPFVRVPCTTEIPEFGGHMVYLRIVEWSHGTPVPRRVGGG